MAMGNNHPLSNNHHIPIKRKTMKNIVKKRFDIRITEPNKIFSKTFELDKTIATIKGVLFTSDKDDLLYYRGSQRIEINKQEIFPENYESKLLMTGINVAPNLRYYDVDVPVGNGSVKVEYKDTNDGRTGFEAYRISIYLSCELV
jgi:hypothetical protein